MFVFADDKCLKQWNSKRIVSIFQRAKIWNPCDLSFLSTVVKCISDNSTYLYWDLFYFELLFRIPLIIHREKSLVSKQIVNLIYPSKITWWYYKNRKVKHNLPWCPISRVEKIIINRKTRSLIFDPRTVYKDKNYHQNLIEILVKINLLFADLLLI